VEAVAAGGYHNLALRRDGTVLSWRVGAEAILLPDFSDVVAIAAGSDGTLALKHDGTLVGWGDNSPPPEATNIVAIACGLYHSLALKADGTVVAWGINFDGQTDVPAGLNDVVAIACSYGCEE
jgi:alpha-tubulin suppressor-like RCC1 family protein